AAEATMTNLFEVVTRIRNARAESNVEPGRWIAATVWSPTQSESLRSVAGEFSMLARIAADELTFAESAPTPGPHCVVIAVGDMVVILPLTGVVDLDAERTRIGKQLGSAQSELERIDRQLSN